MKKRVFALALLMILSLVPVLGGCSGGESGGLPAPGKKAPDFQLNALEGGQVSLSDYAGSSVLVNFWASWCGPCRLEMPFLQRVHQSGAWEMEGLKVIGVNIQETSGQVSAFMAKYELTFPVLMDYNGEVARQYNVSGIPASFFIDENGIIRKIKVGAYTSLSALESDVMDLLWGETE